MTLQERCQKIWEKAGIEQKKIDWLISCLTSEAIANSDKITDEQILMGKSHLLWCTFQEAVTNYIAWEKEQN
jgi:hypothetical protein